MADEDDSRIPQAEINLLILDAVQKLQALYEPGQDRKVTPLNVYQSAVLPGRDLVEGFVERLLLPGSAIEGVAHLDDCLRRMEAGQHILLLPEHRGNLDTASFYVLTRRAGARFEPILERLTYIAGRKLNESSDFVKMFTEKYSRLIIVPRRDLPDPVAGESGPEAREREAYLEEAARINRAAFRELVRLRRAGYLFVLFPLGGRLKPDADNVPVPETTSYLKAFDTAYLVSMEGNLLPPLPTMEDERPVQDKVIFRVGPALETKPFLARQRQIYRQAGLEGGNGGGEDFNEFTAGRIMKMLESLRLTGSFDPAFPHGA